MTMKQCILALLLILTAAPFAYGKGPVDLILISGGGLNQPVEITTPRRSTHSTRGSASLRIGSRSRWWMLRAIAAVLKYCSI